jgi:hypothetical protein
VTRCLQPSVKLWHVGVLCLLWGCLEGTPSVLGSVRSSSAHSAPVHPCPGHTTAVAGTWRTSHVIRLRQVCILAHVLSREPMSCVPRYGAAWHTVWVKPQLVTRASVIQALPHTDTCSYMMNYCTGLIGYGNRRALL